MDRTLACGLLAVVFLVSALEPVNAADASPIQRVLTMLSDMLKVGETNSKAEKVDMVAAEGQCSNNEAALERSILSDSKEVQKQEALKLQAEANIEGVNTLIEKYTQQITSLNQEKEQGQRWHDRELDKYHQELGELTAAVDALKEGIQSLGAVQGSVALPSASLLQGKTSERLTQNQKVMMEALMARLVQIMPNVTNPEAYAYESKSGGILGTLQKLLMKFEDEKNAAEKAATQATFDWEKAKLLIRQQAQAQESAKEAKLTLLNTLNEKVASATGSLDTARASLTTRKADLTNEKFRCETEQKEFAKNQRVRQEELDAIQAAIDALGDLGSVKPSGYSAATMLIQLSRRGTSPETELRSRVAKFMRERSQALGSQSLSLLSTRVAEDPLQVAKRMIKDLMLKMVAEANVDTEEERYCDNELETNALSRANAQEWLEGRIAEVEAEEAAAAITATQISENAEELAHLSKSLADATKLRQKDEKDNKEVMQEAKKSQFALENAIKSIRDFYEKPGSTLLQTGNDDANADALTEAMTQRAGGSAPYVGQDASNVIELLETILRDFSQLETDTDNKETLEASDHEKFDTETRAEIAVQETVKEQLLKKKSDHVTAIRMKKNELRNAQVMLSTSLQTYETLKVKCVDIRDWQARIVARNKEIEACQEALKMLNAVY